MTTSLTNLGNQGVASQFPSIFDPQTCTRRGMCPVTPTQRQHEPFSLYFEVHGNGPEKVVLIMGLYNTSFSWLPQVEHFSKLEQYSTLVFDNRGAGFSGSPRGPYSTDGMAEDVLCLLDYLQWTEDRSLHVVGLSFGGMVSQKLAYLIPNRIMSLSLFVTPSGGNIWASAPSPGISMHLLRLLIPPKPEKQVAIFEKILFPKDWLDSVAEDDPEGRTNREVHRESFLRRMEITKPQTIKGAFSQLAASVTHRIKPDRLAQISASVPKVLIMSGAEDVLLPSIEGEKLKRYMPEAEYQCWERTGHYPCAQYVERFNQLLEKVFEEGRKGAGKRVE